jgi:hypothetical protein
LREVDVIVENVDAKLVHVVSALPLRQLNVAHDRTLLVLLWLAQDIAIPVSLLVLLPKVKRRRLAGWVP